jgi:ATP-dependent exoDNAse (exonuclease V) beta subunit
MTLADSTARAAIANDLDRTLVVEAAAGTGKTTELVNRIVRILASGRAKVEGIVAVTFTEKAAGELKLRLREALDLARAEAPAPRHGSGQAGERDALNQALQSLEEAHVSTIHGFCAELLRERPVEARVDPLFSVLTEPQAQRTFDQAFGAWIQAELQESSRGCAAGCGARSGGFRQRDARGHADRSPPPGRVGARAVARFRRRLGRACSIVRRHRPARREAG